MEVLRCNESLQLNVEVQGPRLMRKSKSKPPLDQITKHSMPESGDEDDLDMLMQVYEDESRAQMAAAVDEAQRKAKRPKKNATENLNAGLDQQLPEDNVGFKMLTKMGFKAGGGLGKGQSGRADPIPLTIKQDKAGLGRVSKKQQRRGAAQQAEAEALQRQQELQAAAAQSTEEQVKAHRQLQTQRFTQRRIAGQLRQAQGALETLDNRHGIDSSVMWYRPPTEQEDAINDIGGEPELAKGVNEEMEAWQVLSQEEQLTEVVTRLRETYHYCFYCGSEYRDAEEMEEHCPGPGEEDHE